MGLSVDKLAAELAQGLSEYSQSIADEIKKAADEAESAAVRELKNTSPAQTGSYAKGWTKKNAYEDRRSKRNTVYNKTDYQLTHLLEKGHASRNGGRVAARVHIQPVEEKVVADFEERVKRAIEG